MPRSSEGWRLNPATLPTPDVRPPLTQAETQWYQPTIVEAHLHLEAPTNSTPEKWFSSLYDAQFDFSHMISQLKAARGGSE